MVLSTKIHVWPDLCELSTLKLPTLRVTPGFLDNLSASQSLHKAFLCLHPYVLLCPCSLYDRQPGAKPGKIQW